MWTSLPGREPTSYRMLWAGTVPGHRYPFIVTAGVTAHGVEVVASTGTFREPISMTVTAVRGPDPSAKVDPLSMSTTALVDSADFAAVRLADPADADRLGDSLLVIAAKGTTSLTASTGAPAVRVDDGVWLMKAPAPATVTLTAGPGGQALTVDEADASGLLFDQPVGSQW